MIPHPVKNCSGFTYIAAMCLVIIMGIMLGAVGQSWQTIIKREKEAELLFRGDQIAAAIERWRKPPPGAPATLAPMPIKDLKDLLEDPRSAQKVHYLRKIYLDPITNKDFDLIRGTQGGVIGVASSSNEKPLKISFQNISAYAKFNNKEKYSDWKFVPTALQGQIPGQTNVMKLPGQPPPPEGM